MKPARYTAALIAALALVLSGCGGGDDDSSAKSPDKGSVGQSVDPDDVEDAIDGIADGANIDDECKFLLKLALAPGLVAGGQLDPSTLEGIEVPDEIKDDVEIYLAALEDYLANPDGGTEALSSDEFNAAAAHISEYAEEKCPDFGS